ncbi:MAG: metallophosphoesterase [Theionarchaea archaeon]|nr:metallophosphoesterase [Theionarchaea archaeon]MBU7018176.1 metallophosphoesterase [Theionarchaea archaeon]MBU7019731.1 metallophosphoesterase [Theionarchaea archaeon]
MLIGIMADTHDRLTRVRKALSIFREEGIITILHAGDFISPFTIPLFSDFEVYGVLGNNDGERKGLFNAFSSIHGTLREYFVTAQLDSTNVCITHGHIPELLALILKSGLYDVVITGHTHEPEIREGTPIVINPGECCGYLSDRSTIAVFDTQKKKGEILEIH